MKIVVDSYTWIEHFLGTKKGKKADDLLQNSEEIYTPDIVLAEIARKYAREGADDNTIRMRLQQIEQASSILCLDSELALTAAKCYLEMQENTKKLRLGSPGLFDAIVLAAGRMLGAQVLTGDPHFQNLAETLWLE